MAKKFSDYFNGRTVRFLEHEDMILRCSLPSQPNINQPPSGGFFIASYKCHYWTH